MSIRPELMEAEVFKGFRDFILRGNVVDLAVAVVIGAAFAAVVKAFADNLITPIVNMILAPNVVGGLQTKIADQVINWSALINAAIAFLITAVVVYFLFVAPMNRLRNRFGKGKKGDDAEAALSEEVTLLREIRDLLKERG